MNDKQNESTWSVWLVREYPGKKIEQFFGGEVPQPWDVFGVYRLREEAERYRPSHIDWSYNRVLVEALYEEPIAWMVRTPEDGCPDYVGVSRGCPVGNADENWVAAIFQTEAEAEAYIAEKERQFREYQARLPDWRTLPDNCANCGHPFIWHTQAGDFGCLWEDDLDSDGHWAMCLKQCKRYVAPDNEG